MHYTTDELLTTIARTTARKVLTVWWPERTAHYLINTLDPPISGSMETQDFVQVTGAVDITDYVQRQHAITLNDQLIQTEFQGERYNDPARRVVIRFNSKLPWRFFNV